MGKIPRWILYLLLILIYLLHNDLWFWHNPGIVLGLPVGLLYHILYCVFSSFVLYILVKSAWPKYLQESKDGGRS